MTEPRYVLGDKIGTGGMAEIFLGKQISTDGFQRLCAVKRILPHLLQNTSFINMFRDEAHICKKLQHTNIVRIESFENIEGAYAIIMEFINGSDLRSILSVCERTKSHLSVPMTLYIVAEAARGLHYAHTKKDDLTSEHLNIIHRDISPQNILISFEGEVKLTDFGIANAKSKTTETQTGTVKGKYSYMSPEQIQAKKLDCRTDIFSLGIVLWELLAMRKLFQSSNDISTIGRVRECKIPLSLAEKNEKVSPELETTILKALGKKPKDRFQTAEEMENALRKFLYTSFPEFNPSDLGNFIQKKLSSRHKKTQKYIKAILTAKVVAKVKPQQKPTQQLKPLVEREYLANAPKVIRPIKKPTHNVFDHRATDISFKPKTFSADSASQKPAIVSRRSEIESYSTKSVLAANILKKRRKEKNKYIKKSSIPFIPLLAVGIVVFIAILYYAKDNTVLRLPIGKQLQLKLDSTPAIVKIFLDGKEYEKGRYVKTPITISSNPGAHTVRILRPGYVDNSFIFQGRKGQIIEKTMVLSPSARFSYVRFVSRNKRRQFLIDIDNGFYRGKTPFLAHDLRYGRSHNVKIIPIEGSSRRPIRCLIKPTSSSRGNPDIIVIDSVARKCTRKRTY